MTIYSRKTDFYHLIFRVDRWDNQAAFDHQEHRRPWKAEERVMATVIKVKCLICGHVGHIAEQDLPDYGFKPDAPIALISKRLKCRECGSRAMSAQRQVSAGKVA